MKDHEWIREFVDGVTPPDSKPLVVLKEECDRLLAIAAKLEAVEKQQEPCEYCFWVPGALRTIADQLESKTAPELEAAEIREIRLRNCASRAKEAAVGLVDLLDGRVPYPWSGWDDPKGGAG